MALNSILDIGEAKQWPNVLIFWSDGAWATIVVTEQFDQLHQWYTNNGLALNIPKTKYILISNRNTTTSEALPLYLNNTLIKQENTIVQLGITIDSKLSLDQHVNKIVTDSNNKAYSIRKIRHLLNYEEAKLIYTSIIRPKLEYCSSLFLNLNKSQIKKLESAQNKSIRIICRAPNLNFSITDARKLLNLHTLVSRRSIFFRT